MRDVAALGHIQRVVWTALLYLGVVYILHVEVANWSVRLSRLTVGNLGSISKKSKHENICGNFQKIILEK